MPWFFPLSRMPEGMGLLDAGTARVGPSERRCRLCPTLAAAVTADPDSARQLAAWWVSFYLTTMGPFYAQTLDALGFGSEVKAVLAANPDGRVGDVPAGAEVLLDELIIYGTPDAARHRLDGWYRACASFPILSLPPNRPWDELDYALRALAPRAAGLAQDIADYWTAARTALDGRMEDLRVLAQWAMEMGDGNGR